MVSITEKKLISTYQLLCFSIKFILILLSLFWAMTLHMALFIHNARGRGEGRHRSLLPDMVRLIIRQSSGRDDLADSSLRHTVRGRDNGLRLAVQGGLNNRGIAFGVRF